MSDCCLDSATLLAFLAGELAAKEDAAVALHLQNCAACDQLAQNISGDNEARQLLRHRSAEDCAGGDVSLGELRGRLAALAMLTAERSGLASGLTSTCGAVDTTVELPPAKSPVIPRRLGKFAIERQLGSGGFGIVYLATDTVLERRVALKLPRASSLADPDLRRRLAREAAALARLDHPRIVPVYEAGEDGGTAYLAVGYCEGPTLADWLAKSSVPLEPRQAGSMALGLSEAIEHAHTQGILHRDIKPSNILFESVPGDGMLPAVRLTDFGLAKLTDEQHYPHATQSGIVLGTPQYMAPEQAAGMVDRIGPASDVYGLGGVLYHLLTGQPPIRGQGSADTLRRVLVDDPEPPRRINPAVPADLDAIVMKCLEKSATRRYATAGELASDLRRFLAGQPTRARPLRAGERSLRWLQRNPTASTVGVLLAALVLLGAVLLAVDQSRRATLKQIETTDRRIAEIAYANDMVQGSAALQARDVAAVAEIVRKHPEGSPQRGLECAYLDSLINREVVAEASVGTDVYQVAVSHQGHQVAAACRDGDVRLFTVPNLKFVRGASAGLGELNGVSFYPQDNFLVVSGKSGEMRSLNLSSDKKWRAPFKAHPGEMYSAIRLTNSTMITCGNDPVIRVWNTAMDFKVRASLKNHTADVEAIAVSPDGKWLASVGSDNRTVLWDLGTNKARWRARHHAAAVVSIAFSPDGTRAATAGKDKRVVVCDVATHTVLFSATHPDTVQSVAFLGKDGAHIVSGDRKGTLRVWRMPPDSNSTKDASLTLEEAWQGHDGIVWSLAALPGPNRFVSSGADGKIRVWDRGGADRVQRIVSAGPKDQFRDVAIAPDTSLVWGLREIHGPAQYDVNLMAHTRTLHSGDRRYMSMVLMEDRGQVAVWTASGELLVFDLKSGKLSYQTQPAQADLRGGLSYSRHAGLLSGVGSDGERVLLIDPSDGEVAETFPIEAASTIAISSDGWRLATNSLDDIVIFDLQDRREVHRWPSGSRGLNELAYSTDGRLLASCSNDRIVKVWTGNGRLVTRLTMHRAGVNCVAFSPDGKTLLSADDHGVVWATNVATLMPMLQIETGTTNIRRLLVFNDSRRLALLGDDRRLTIIGRTGDR